MESIDRLATISLTKDNRQKILDINEMVLKQNLITIQNVMVLT